ncbi:hypothetical protein [Flagellimonas sp.]|uniref:hypothetical protein n=1 Tax=Flagellimonas sp. TaxID=2058762 RepID=UPI003B51273F
MTKKFVISVSDIGKDEFVIPDIFDNESYLLGIKTGKIYQEGIICYTGVDLSASIVLDKIMENRSLDFFQKRKALKIIDKYLVQIKKFKISTKVKIDKDFVLSPIDK